MRRHWQKKPLLVRQAITGMRPLLSAPQLFALAARAEVESRLIERSGRTGQSWKLRRGPFSRRALPALGTPGWTLLVQGVDLHHQGAHELLQRFRFIPDARLDDLMISYASAEGGVGPHFDSYDVFLLQASGSRRWQIGAQSDLGLREDAPLKILRDFRPSKNLCCMPATCSTCRRATPTMAWLCRARTTRAAPSRA
jgi:50S ribosomal protein L16 3-hydroxylase